MQDTDPMQCIPDGDMMSETQVRNYDRQLLVLIPILPYNTYNMP
jgi:hypothetical protein